MGFSANSQEYQVRDLTDVENVVNHFYKLRQQVTNSKIVLELPVADFDAFTGLGGLIGATTVYTALGVVELRPTRTPQAYIQQVADNGCVLFSDSVFNTMLRKPTPAPGPLYGNILAPSTPTAPSIWPITSTPTLTPPAPPKPQSVAASVSGLNLLYKKYCSASALKEFVNAQEAAAVITPQATCACSIKNLMSVGHDAGCLEKK
jgi:hypothetical protein